MPTTLVMVDGESYRVGQIGGFFRIPIGYTQLYSVCSQVGADAIPPGAGGGTAALEYVKKGIRVNAVNPGLIDTQIGHDVFKGDVRVYSEAAKGVPIGRAGRSEEIASVVLWLCSPGASYVVGHGLTVDGGMTVA